MPSLPSPPWLFLLELKCKVNQQWTGGQGGARTRVSFHLGMTASSVAVRTRCSSPLNLSLFSYTEECLSLNSENSGTWRRTDRDDVSILLVHYCFKEPSTASGRMIPAKQETVRLALSCCSLDFPTVTPSFTSLNFIHFVVGDGKWEDTRSRRGLSPGTQLNPER